MVSLDGEEHHFVGEVLVFEPPRELTFEQFWVGSDWQAPTKVTILLTEVDGGGTLVELFHHGYELLGGDAGGGTPRRVRRRLDHTPG